MSIMVRMGSNKARPARKSSLSPPTPKTKAGILLWVDDDAYAFEACIEWFRMNGYEVLTATNGDEALAVLRKRGKEIGAVILDIMLTPGKFLSGLDTFQGRRTGLVLARYIKEHYPKVRLVGCSNLDDHEVEDWFASYGAGYIEKSASFTEIKSTIIRALTGQPGPLPNCFIVHGHDGEALYQLKNYLQNTLKWREPIVLREQPSLGRTMIEKFEAESDNVDLVFVLMTPDDTVAGTTAASSNDKRRSRQNVIFELGYFFGRLQRRKGRVFLLYKGQLELPSDINGIAYIDISQGIEAAGEELRRELRHWL